MQPDPKLVVFSDGKRALLPLSTQKSYKGLMTKKLSSPAGTFGGWISTDKLGIEHATLLSKHLTRKFGDLVWRVNPYDNLVLEAGVEGAKDETHALALAGGFDAVYAGWTKGHSSAARKARKARKEGVLVRCAITLQDWHAYYGVYQDSVRRWGSEASSVYRWEIFEEMFRRRSPNIKLWLSFYQDKVVAGALCLYSTNHVVYWHGAAAEAYFRLRPVNLLMYEAIRDACEQGYAWFDFNPSGGHEGVKAFKKSFGAEALECPVVSVETCRTRLFRKLLSIGQK